MPRLVITPYNGRVSAAREIAERLNGIRVKRLNSRYRYRRGDFIVNWGRSELDTPAPFIVNAPGGVREAIDKSVSFRRFNAADVPTVEWTEDRDVATGWWRGGNNVLCRTRVAGRGGEGIVFMGANDAIEPSEHANHAEFPRAPLYTKYFKHKDEFRVHVYKGRVIDVQKKKLRTEVRDKLRGPNMHDLKDFTYTVRSYANGWIFAREGVTCPEQVAQAAIDAVGSLWLDFGAVDIGWNRHHQRAAVFEVNTAPGIEGTTIDKYVEAIREDMSNA